ncbi:hypothetical protein [Endozoicomonas atrinae]|uniref:hypothetical protein n=2 Tax=Endozoicomonas atrinae TaxID=1333660 RepID=UPI000824491D|nr:hypothetical protein [Endozoicomonas atrinae]
MQALTSSSSQNGNAPFMDSEPVSSIDELILSGPPWQSGRFLKSVLNELANDQDQRWLTLILSSEQAKNTINWLKSSGISRHRLQVLNPSAQADPLKLTQKALASGTSHTVVSWIKQMDSITLSELETAARSGRCQGLAIRNRG